MEIDFPEAEWGEYQINITAEDCAGNRTVTPLRQSFRYNAPPQLDIPEFIQTFPGEPLVLDAFLWGLQDSDGLGDIRFNISRPGFFEACSASREGCAVTWLFQSEIENSITPYLLECNVTDHFGQSTSYFSTIEVVNTQVGTLMVDQYWSGIIT